MSKAYIFPGQGSQFPGMGKALYERSQEARELMDKACEILGFPITDIMFGESADDLKATRRHQPWSRMVTLLAGSHRIPRQPTDEEYHYSFTDEELEVQRG